MESTKTVEVKELLRGHGCDTFFPPMTDPAKQPKPSAKPDDLLTNEPPTGTVTGPTRTKTGIVAGFDGVPHRPPTVKIGGK